MELGPTKSVRGARYDWEEEVNMIGDISKASRIRIGIKTLNHGWNSFLFFAEENNANSKGINYWMDVHQDNEWNLPTYKQKNGHPDSDLVAQKGRIERKESDKIFIGKLLKKNEIRWFEFEWNVNGSQMQVSKIKDEKGENKEFLHEWPMLDNKLNWLMFTTGW